MPKSVRDFLEERLGIRTTPFENRDASDIGITAARVLRQDPSRVSFLVVNLSLNNVFLRPRRQATAAAGIRLAPNGGSLEVNWEADGEVVAYEWFGLADGAASAIYVLENVIQTGK